MSSQVYDPTNVDLLQYLLTAPMLTYCCPECGLTTATPPRVGINRGDVVIVCLMALLLKPLASEKGTTQQIFRIFYLKMAQVETRFWI